jgi:WD40 repeat protein
MAPTRKSSKRKISHDSQDPVDYSAENESNSDDGYVHSHALSVPSEKHLTKRSKVSDIVPVTSQVVTVKKTNERTSDLQAPTMLLTGHNAAVYSLKFDPTGQHAASSSFDKTICEYR